MLKYCVMRFNFCDEFLLENPCSDLVKSILRNLIERADYFGLQIERSHINAQDSYNI